MASATATVAYIQRRSQAQTRKSTVRKVSRAYIQRMCPYHLSSHLSFSHACRSQLAAYGDFAVRLHLSNARMQSQIAKQ